MQKPECVVAYSAEDIRGAEAHILARVPEGTLMRRAAVGLAVVCSRVLRERQGRTSGRRVVLLVGSGNNGGDALLAGARLRKRGVTVHAVLTGGLAYEPGLSALLARGGRVIDAGTLDGRKRASQMLKRADLIVDGIVGIGGSVGLQDPAAGLIAEISKGTPVIAVDLPSGVDPDTGETAGPHVWADITVTFGAFKGCLLLPPACRYAGSIEFIDVGLGSQLSGIPRVRRVTSAGAAVRWPIPRREDNKYSRGVLGIVAGSDMYPGAAVLACSGAVRAGAGIVRYVGPAGATDHVLATRPEVVRGPGRVQAWLLGSGVKADPEQDTAIEQALDSGLPCLVDAGALEACIRRRVDRPRTTQADSVLLTPHAGELTRMLGFLGYQVERKEVEARPLYYTQWLARKVDATVLLKGFTTLIADPHGMVSSQEDGSAWLATAGSGDVLAGIAGALMAAGLNAMDAGSVAALVHGRAAIRASNGGPIAALDISDAVPATTSDLLRFIR